MTERTIFLNALERPDPAERAAYLQEVCGSDGRLHLRICQLLRAHEESSDFLNGLPVEFRGTEAFEKPKSRPTGVDWATEKPGTLVGPYKLLQQIGEGGMGTVFMAEQTEPVRRRVAVKVIKAGLDSRHVIARFEAERQALALMEHTNIARVLDAGTTPQGRPYFVMELVQGVPITRFCDDNNLTPRQRLELFIPVCHAIQHAHLKGVIHRDIKPSNVMVTLYDGQPVPKVIDFGVAKATAQTLTERTLFTQYNAVVGTLEYMSPEQAEMSALGVDTRSDVYSLGVLLYELLTGSTPLQRERMRNMSYSELLRTIKEEEPPRPSSRLSSSGAELASISAHRKMEPGKLTRMLERELDWIVLKPLEKDRNRRYESASAFAADIQRYLHDEPVHACPPSSWYRFSKLARRNKAAMATTLALLLGILVAVGSLIATVQVLAASNATVRTKAEETRDALEREKSTTNALAAALMAEEQTRYFRSIALAERELVVGNVGRAEELLDDCPAKLRGWEWHHLKRRPYGAFVFRQHGSGVWAVAFAPDGTRIASTSFQLPLGQVLIWNRSTGEIQHRLLAHFGPIEGLAFSACGRFLATASWDKSVKIWDAATGKQLHALLGHTEYVRRVAFSRDGKYLASGGGETAIRLWDAKTFQPLGKLTGHSGGIFGLAFGKGAQLGSASADGTIRVWDVETRKERHTLRGHAGPALAVAFSSDGARIASGGFDGTAHVWDAESGKPECTLHIDSNATTCVAFSKDGQRLVVGSLEKSIRFWDLPSRQEIFSLGGHTDTSMDLVFSPNGEQLASASMDGTVRVWDSSPLLTGPKALPLRGHPGAVFNVAFRPDQGQAAEPMLASGSQDETVKLWNPTAGEEIRTLAAHAAPVFRVFFSRDGERFLTADFAGVVKVWDRKFREIRSFRSFAGVAGMSHDGQRVALTAEGALVQICDATTGVELVPPFRAHEAPIVSVAFSPDGKLLATGSWDGTVKLWDAASGRAIRTCSGEGIICSVTFTPDGRRVAAASWNRTAMIWDSDSGKLLQTMRGHEHRVIEVTFSPDGRFLATASQDNTARVWDADTGKPLVVLHGHIGYVMSVAFSPDGKRLASSGGYRARGDIRIWDSSAWSPRARP